MEPLELHEFHQALHGTFAEVNGAQVVRHYGDPLAEHRALLEAAGVLDLSFRGRVCLTGGDRVRYLNGQVTQNVKLLSPGRGGYAALTTAKGKMESDLYIHCLNDELLLDFEPGLTARVAARLQKFIVADEVEVVEVKPQYGLLSVQGPKAGEVLQAFGLPPALPKALYHSITVNEATWGELVLVNLPRFGTNGFDLFVPNQSLGAVAERLIAAASTVGGGACGWDAMEMVRIEAGLPRYGQDMDETHIPLEAGLEARAISYAKGCYIGQEVINRIHSVGQVSKALRGLQLAEDLAPLPERGARLYHEGKEVGSVSSVLHSPRFRRCLALGYVRREVNQVGTRLSLQPTGTDTPVLIVNLPFSDT